jgi:hypothetical protein
MMTQVSMLVHISYFACIISKTFVKKMYISEDIGGLTFIEGGTPQLGLKGCPEHHEPALSVHEKSGLVSCMRNMESSPLLCLKISGINT